MKVAAKQPPKNVEVLAILRLRSDACQEGNERNYPQKESIVIGALMECGQKERKK